MNKAVAKKIVLIGFGLNLLIRIVYSLAYVAGHFYGSEFYTLFVFGQAFSIGIAAVGFLVMWFISGDMLDFLSCGSCGAFGLAAILSLASFFNLIPLGLIGRTIFSLVAFAYYAVLALRAKNFNMILFLMLICAYIYQIFSGEILPLLLNSSPYFRTYSFIFIPVLYIADPICAGLCFVEAKTEQ